MKSGITSLVLAGVLASAGFATYAQTAATQSAQAPAMASSGAKHHHDMGMHGKRDPAKREAMFTKRTTALKAKLQITPEQEGAWASFTTAMKPGTRKEHQRPDRAEMEKLTTPERIDKKRALRTQHMTDRSAAMDKRGEATKALYAALNADQKKTFDSVQSQMGRRHGEHLGWHRGGHHGNGSDQATGK